MIEQQVIQDIVAMATSQGPSETLVAELRTQYPQHHFTYCMDDDMDAHTPALEGEGFNIYYVNSSNHCSVLTRDPEQASGMVVAEVIEDW